MAHKLADETLAQIFALHFDVPDDVFNSSEPYSRLYEKQWASSSHVLVVCKRWMRVATPALYHIVILRSAAQAKALCSALKSNTALGRFIRRIRVERGFGASSEKIISQAPNLTDIVVNMNIYSDDSTKGLCKVLPKINPKSVGLTWVWDEKARSRPENANERSLRTTILECLPAWINLARVYACAIYLGGSGGSAFRDAIAGARNLQALHLYLTSSIEIFSVDHLYQVARRARVRQIALYNAREDPRKDLVTPFIEKVRVLDVNLAAKIVNMNPILPTEPHTRARGQDPPATLNTAPLHSSPVEIQQRIWTQIIGMAMEEHCHWLDDIWYHVCGLLGPEPPLCPSQNTTYMLVCKMFLRIVQQEACRKLCIRSPAMLLQFIRVADQTPELETQVERVSLSFPTHTRDSECKSALSRLLARVSLRSLSTGYSLTAEHWKALSTASGSSLQELCVGPSVGRRKQSPGPITLSASVFLPLASLTSLWWASDMPVILKGETVDLASTLPSLSLLRVHTDGGRADPLLLLLAGMQLPSLRTFDVDCVTAEARAPAFQRFIGAHGHKLTKLRMGSKHIPDYLALCPNITRLEIRDISRDLGPWLKGSHERLEVVDFDNTSAEGSLVNAKCPWKAIFDNFDISGFPALRVFRISIEQLTGHFEWPTEQRAVAKSPWTVWGEKLMGHEVKLIDIKAGQWRPRLQATIRGTRTRATH